MLDHPLRLGLRRDGTGICCEQCDCQGHANGQRCLIARADFEAHVILLVESPASSGRKPRYEMQLSRSQGLLRSAAGREQVLVRCYTNVLVMRLVARGDKALE